MTTPVAQLVAMRGLPENWDGYGAAAPEPQVIDLATEFVGMLEALFNGRALPPDAIHVSPTRVGGVLIEWEDAKTQHEVDINPDQSFSFLHSDKATGHIESHKLVPSAATVVHHGLLQELSQLFAA